MQQTSQTNSGGATLGPRGYVVCRTCGKEEFGISRSSSFEYAFCLIHRSTKQLSKEKVMSEKKPKAKREKGAPVLPIRWFQEKAQATQDPEEIRAAAEAENYSKSTISIQLGRLRANDMLPKLERAEKPAKEKKAKASGVRAVPKPGKSKKKAA